MDVCSDKLKMCKKDKGGGVNALQEDDSMHIK